MGAIAGQAPRTSHDSSNRADAGQIGSVNEGRPMVQRGEEL